ncbi:AfsR/SARP family transcriptional regulator [Bailinhaonella thermotolerans]|uniref:AfsR/SARP family transcriptional regulator n=1 Tax=Bailinhaonella thermotolerans TaxID=1070861 RepID=UPI00192A48C2|nr:BTAD domain-containing putative transcriptional regulator [Bailinhaonella thermotolerans]
MRFGVLGATVARRGDGVPVALGGGRVRALFALLALNAGDTVSAGRLIDGLYGERAPAGAANALQSGVSRLRRALGEDGLVEYGPAGYRLAADPAEVDVRLFERLAAEGRRALAGDDPEGALPPLREALALWRGPALADVRAAPFAAPQAARLEELRVSALEDRVEAELLLGLPQSPIADLRDLIAAHPLRERPRAQLMRALYAQGRRAEALAAYEDLRQTLAHHLGTDPSRELTALHLSLLTDTVPGAAAMPGPAAPGTTAPGTVSTPGPAAPGAAPAPLPAARGRAPADSGRTPSPAPPYGIRPGAPVTSPRAVQPEATPPDAVQPDAVHPDATPGAVRPDAAPPYGAGVEAGGRPRAAGAGAAVRATARWGVPAQVSSFVGREEELARVGERLERGRLVTLVGAGGAGKTRLAVEASGRWDGEVCFVELAPLTAGDDLARAALEALGVRESASLTARGVPVDSLERLIAVLSERPALLVLDNCEHLVGDVAALAQRVLAACPGLRVLATSREPLGITGEALCPVPPLPLPGEDDDPLSSPAVRLFAERAAAVRPDFALGEGDAELVARLCRALDGLPLAIELAAARLRALPLEEIAARLDDRFALLSRGSRTAQPRHQTLRAVVAWSWDLLEEDERVLARRLTVFAGGATLEAAELVCGLPGEDTVELLAGLVDKSLVDVAGGRYRMLETIRAYGAERLAESGEEERLHRAHAEYFLDLAQRADPHLRRREQLDWLRRLEAEHDNLAAALRWAIDSGNAEIGLRLVAAQAYPWRLRGPRADSAAQARRVLDLIPEGSPPGLRDEHILCLLVASWDIADPVRLGAHLGRVEALLESGHRSMRHPVIGLLWAMAAGPPEDVMAEWDTFSRLDGLDPWTMALSHMGIAFVLLFNGKTARAEEEFSRALERFRELGDRWGTLTVLSALAQVSEWRGDQERTLALTAEALRLSAELGPTDELVELRCQRGRGRLRAGDLDGAREELEIAVGQARRLGSRRALAEAYRGLGEIARARGDLAGARDRYETALRECAHEGFEAQMTRLPVLVALARVALAEGDPGEAAARLDRVVAAAYVEQDQTLAAEAATGAAELALTLGHAERAALLLGAAGTLRGAVPANDPDLTRVTAAVRAALGDAAHARLHAEGASLPRSDALALLRAPLT